MNEVIIKTLNVIISQLDERVLTLQESLADGHAKDFADYKKICGEVKGLFYARNYINDLKQNMENSDE